MRRIDLNVDVAEGFDDKAFLGLATSANICPGGHAGSVGLARDVIELCRRHSVNVGVHPGFPDRQQMGRRPATDEEIGLWWDEIIAQSGSLGTAACYLKAHGALYNQSTVPGRAYDLLVACLRATGLPLVGLAGTEHVGSAHEAGVAFVAEGFVERGYQPDGRLVERGSPGDLLHDVAEIASQAVLLAPVCQTLCVHGDRPDALELLVNVRAAVEADGYEVRAFDLS